MNGLDLEAVYNYQDASVIWLRSTVDILIDFVSVTRRHRHPFVVSRFEDLNKKKIFCCYNIDLVNYSFRLTFRRVINHPDSSRTRSLSHHLHPDSVDQSWRWWWW